MKKFVTILMALAIILSFSASAFAALTPGIDIDTDLGEYITGNNVSTGEMDEYFAGHNMASSFLSPSGERSKAALSNGGLQICLMEDDSLYQYVHPYEVVNVEFREINRLSEKAAEALREARNTAKQMEGKCVKQAYFFTVPGTYTLDEEHYAKYLFSCPGDNVEVFVNGNPVEVVSVNGRTSYIAKIIERGCITILVDK